MSEPTAEQLADLGQAVLDEHRAALEHERDVTSPAKLAAALTASDRVKELLEALL